MKYKFMRSTFFFAEINALDILGRGSEILDLYGSNLIHCIFIIHPIGISNQKYIFNIHVDHCRYILGIYLYISISIRQNYQKNILIYTDLWDF